MRAAFYECEATPPLGGFMWGHYREKLAEDVVDRLYVKAVVTEDKGEVAAIVVIDSCSIPPEMCDIVTKRIYEYTGISPDRVCITSNHTHWGEPISDSAEVRCFADKAYCDVFYRIVADCVTLAYRRLDEAEAKFGMSEVPGITFCRDYLLKDGRIVTHGKKLDVERVFAKADESLAVMTFERDGKPIGAIINFACHQCCCGGIKGYSGDYSSILSKELKKVYGEDFVSLFVLGTCGDLTHVNNDKNIDTPPLWYHEMGRRIAVQTQAAMADSKPVSGGIEVVKETMTIERRQATPEVIMKHLKNYVDNGGGSLMRLRNLLHYEGTAKEPTQDVKIQAFHVGNVCFYCMPGEVFVNFGYRLKNESKFENNIVIENCNCYCGYVPTVEAFAEKGDLYETTLCFHSCLIPEAGDMMVDRLIDIANGFEM